MQIHGYFIHSLDMLVHEISILWAPTLTQESIEFRGREVNQLKAAPMRDNGTILILCTLVMPTSLTYTRNYPICSYMVLASSPVNLARSGTRKPCRYGIVSKYSGYDFCYNLAQPLGMNPNSQKFLAIWSLTLSLSPSTCGLGVA
jgi:hypothetical protein